MPDVTPPALQRARLAFDRYMEDLVEAGSLDPGWREAISPLIRPPPQCDLCDKMIDPVAEEYRVGVDGSWAHETHFRRRNGMGWQGHLRSPAQDDGDGVEYQPGRAREADH